MRSKLVLCLLFIVILNGCSNPNNRSSDKKNEADRKFTEEQSGDSLKYLPIINNDSLITIKLPEKIDEKTVIESDEIIKAINYVPLETNDDCLIKSIEKSLVYGDHIYILDNFGKSILKFNLQGKFIKRIGSVGKGPEEYINPIDIFINEKSKRLYVFDDKTSKFLVFDLLGNFVSYEKVEFRLNDVQVLNDSLYAVNTDVRTNFHFPQIADKKLILTNRDWKVLAAGVNYDSKYDRELSFSRNGLSHYKNQLIYNPTFSYYIYTVSSSGLKPKYFIDAGKKALPKGFEHKITYDDFYKKYDNLKADFVYMDNAICESDKILTTTLRYQTRLQYLFYSKRTGKLFSSIYFRNQGKDFSVLTPIQGLSSPEVFYGHIDAVTFVDQRNQFIKGKKGNINSILEKVQVGDNPIIAYFRFKDF